MASDPGRLSGAASAAGEFTLRVYRYDPAGSLPPRYESFRLPLLPKMTVLDAVAYVQSQLDASLAFRFSCRAGMCGTCTMVVNGTERWTCRTPISGLKSRVVTVEPLRHLPVIRDLVVDMAPFFAKLAAVEAAFAPRPGEVGPARIAPDAPERRAIAPHLECITCGACYSACTMLHWDPEYLGPAALNRAFTLVADSRDALGGARLALVDGEHGCWRCHAQVSCTEVCPMDLRPSEAIQRLKRMLAGEALRQVWRPLRTPAADESRAPAAGALPPDGPPGASSPPGPERRRGLAGPLALALLSAAVGVAFLLSAGTASRAMPPSLVAEGAHSPLPVAGLSLFRDLGCGGCHSVLGHGSRRARDLWRVGGRRDAAWLRQLLRDPGDVVPGSGMPRYDLPEPELAALVAYLASLDLRAAEAVQVPPEAARGARVLLASGCLGCHRVAGEGVARAGPLVPGTAALEGVLAAPDHHVPGLGRAALRGLRREDRAALLAYIRWRP